MAAITSVSSARYRVHTSKRLNHLVVDTANRNKPVSDQEGRILLWDGTPEGNSMAFYYATELNKLCTVAEIREGR